MNSVFINTNNGKYYRITVRTEKPGTNIEIAWDNIRNAIAREKTWIGFSEADNFEIKEMMSGVNISAVTLNINNIYSIELLKEGKKHV
ncbi:hypothetical protein [uncultured Catenibacterium sp.]|uniref:hypothetical protein n=1 Tax=uncultured Catenibacterium sp. TaxID=286142 RepID=UPI0025EBAC6B|nr:hypothetical protein [uncultured Catenibacterium sp.]